MNVNELENVKNITSALISALELLGEAPSKTVVEEKAKALAAVFGYAGDLKAVVEAVMAAVDIRMGAGVSLVDPEAEHDEEWVFKQEDIKWIYSDAYEKFLRSEGWHPALVRSLGNVTGKILGHLQNPLSEGSWDRRGLVIGHVQSGKTANYIGLIAKAADAGYKFIVVIAGIHNNLRKQTQSRIDAGFIGRASAPENRAKIGVGLYGSYPHPATLTNVYDDFSKATAAKAGWKINDFSKPVILVIKKNVSTLTHLHKWLKDLNAQGDGKITDVPMLLIDDEADNASINTNKPDLDPTKTNALIRKILGLFTKSCYLGYTATPFANIFINPEAYDAKTYDDLFPRDFIYCLDAPSNYFGPEKVFLDDGTSGVILEKITDCQDFLPLSHKKDYVVEDLPPSLYRAICQFILARTIRNLRGQTTKHCSMMVNVSRFVAVQNTVRITIQNYVTKMSQAVKANYAMPSHVSSANAYMKVLEDEFSTSYTGCGHSWEEIRSTLPKSFETLRVFVINSKSDEALDYERYEKSGTSLAAIAVGGLSLSRGLTIEGLTVSYMYRNTKMYDTLMQMGRWFGFRPSYEDLCRVHLSEDSIGWYSHIAEASEDLRQQVKAMRRDNLSPRKFGLYVRSHPDTLLITAANKMRSAQKVTVKQNFSGRLVESHILPYSDEINMINENLIKDYWRSLEGSLEETDKGWVARDVSVQDIEKFLVSFRVHPLFSESKSAAVDYLRLIEDLYPVGDVLLISIKENGEDMGTYNLGVQDRSSAKLDHIEKVWRMAKARVASRNDEKLGLYPKDKLLSEAEKLAKEDNLLKEATDRHFRMVRKKPLLMIHMLKLKISDKFPCRVPAFGLSFPYGNYDREIEIVANLVWLAQMQGPPADLPDEEEDFDEITAMG